MSETKVVDVILHCQKQLKKERLTEEKILHYLGRLTRLRVTVKDLAETGIGRTVNSLSRNDGPVGQCAEKLVRGWKRMVSEQQNQEAEKESEDDSESNSGSSEEEDEEPTGKNRIEEDEEPYGIHDHQRSGSAQGQRYSNGHSYDRGLPSSSQESRNFQDVDLPEEDFNDDIDDPYMDAGFINVANVHSDGENEEEDDDDSDTSERLAIDDDNNDADEFHDEIEMKASPPMKQEKQYDDRDHKHSSKRSSSHHKSHSESKKSSSSSSSKSHHNHHERSSDKSHRDSKHHQSSKDSSKDHHRSKSSHEERHSSPSTNHRSSHHPSSSKSERPKEIKSEHDTKSHHQKDKEKHHRSKESSSSSYRDKDIRSVDKDHSTDKKDSSNDHHRSSYSSSSSSKSKSREHSSSSTTYSSPKKSSLEVKKEPLDEDRKRKDHPTLDQPSSSKKSKIALKDEIDSNSGINFADVLGSLDTSSASSSSKASSSKKEKDKSHHRRKHHSSKSESSSKHSHSSSKDAGSSSSKRHDPDSLKISKKSGLPQSKIESVIQPVVNISPNYKPMSSSIGKLSKPANRTVINNGHVPPPIALSHVELSDLGSVDFWDNDGKSGNCEQSQEDAISNMLSNRNKNARSKVYSGVKTGRKAEVASLFDLCMQVIKDNIGNLEFTGGIPYDILKPALERANPQQLMSIEAQNDYLIGETDELWQFHCRRDFRGKVPGETESWRELYERCTEERQLKFEVIKNQMKKNIAKAEPVRKAKLAYVDTSCSTRFNPQKAQTIKNGMKTLKIMEEKGPSRGVASSASAGFNNPKKSGSTTNKVVVEDAAVIIAPESRAGHAPAPSVSRESSSAAKLKPRKAPLMQKTMKLIKQLHRR